ncbi:MAG: hypothetical protein ROO71_08380 [Balneola sp.]
MNWIFLPQKRKRSFKNVDGLIQTRFPKRLRNSLKSLSRFNKMVVGLFSIWFAVEVGFLITISLTSFGSLSALTYVEGVKLPESENRSTEFGRRSAIYFVIDKHGVLKMNGEKLPESETISIIKTTRNSYGPYAHAVLVMDTETPMWKVTDLISQINQAGLTRIIFSTDSQEE